MSYSQNADSHASPQQLLPCAQTLTKVENPGLNLIIYTESQLDVTFEQINPTLGSEIFPVTGW